MKLKAFIIQLIISLFLFGCQDEVATTVEDSEIDLPLTEVPDWTDETHSKSADLDYSIVFNQEEVLRFDIKIGSSDWVSMQNDLEENLSASSGGGPGGPGGGGTADVDFDPIWVPCSFNFNEKEWYKVGIRFKGNSSLQSAYQSGNNKLSFKLDFDEFEDDYAIINNQRFYGFKQLNLNNNYDDASLLREKVSADLFRQFGLISAQTAFCVVYIDHGNGPHYYGVYTIVEEMDDTVLETQTSDDDGNLYKPDGDAASFANDTYNDEEMEKKSNDEEADYSDVFALYNAINDDTRTSDTEAWKANLDAIFNVNGFMKWLAANTVIQNWDTYGRMTHNYYLYNNPETAQLNWIPWDNNESLQEGKQGGALSLSMNEIGNSWPLIRYLMDEPEYEAMYKEYLKSFIETVFISSVLETSYQNYYELIKEFAYAEESGYTYIYSNSSFDSAIESLKSHANQRESAVQSFIQ